MLNSLKIFVISLVLCLPVLVAAQTQTAKDYLEQGLQLIKAQKYNEALLAFQKSAQLDAKEPVAQANIGSALIALGRAADAVTPLREAVRLAPNDARFHAGLCQALSLSKSHAEAVAQCEEAVKLGGSTTPETHAALIAALRTAKRPDDALNALDIALAKFAENEILLNSAAEIQTETGNFARATEIYETLARLKPTTIFYQIKLAENYLQFERDADAIAAARKALALEDHPLGHFFLGKIYFELGQNEEAATALKKAIALDPKLSDAYYLLGLSLDRRGKPDDAVTALLQAAALAPENFEYHKQLSSTLNTATRYDEAIAPARKAVLLKPTDFEARVGLGLALFESVRFDEAMPVLMEADKIKPGDPTVNMFLNVVRARQQGLAQVAEMKRFAKENPQDINVRVQLIQLLGYARRLPEAEPYIKEILQSKPKDVRIYQIIGVIYSTIGNYDKAAEIFLKSLEIEQNPGAYLNLASIYAKRGQVEETIKAYDKGLELKPDSPNTMKIYADFLRNNGRRREALEMYKRSLAMLPTNAPALFNAGLLSAKLNDLNAAQQYLQTLKSVDPQLAKTLARCLKIGTIIF